MSLLGYQDFVEGGGTAPSDFSGTIVAARFQPYNYGKTDKPYVLAAYLQIHPDQPLDIGNPEKWLTPEGDVPLYYSLGSKSLAVIAPSDDGINPKGLDAEGYASLAAGQVRIDDSTLPQTFGSELASLVGGDPAPRKGSNWVHFLECLVDAGYPYEALNKIPKITGLIGTHGTIKRIPQKTREGIVRDSKHTPEITVFVNVDKVGDGTAQVSQPAAQVAQIAHPATTGDIAQQVAQWVLARAVEAAQSNATLGVSSLASLALNGGGNDSKKFAGDISAALPLLTNPAHISGIQGVTIDSANNVVLG